ncbi:hypothetical protein FACS1894216_02280 [Synergistales bacterium]|nr:hypothetical protein FACS1894216_02280 [Synergistales bacterium]
MFDKYDCDIFFARPVALGNPEKCISYAQMAADDGPCIYWNDENKRCEFDGEVYVELSLTEAWRRNLKYVK